MNAGALTADATKITTTLEVAGATTLTGELIANGGITCDTDAFTVADTSGNTAIKGTLTVTGVTELTAVSWWTPTVTVATRRAYGHRRHVSGHGRRGIGG